MFYNTRYKAYPDGSVQFLHSERMLTVGVPKKKVGKGSLKQDSDKKSISRTIQEAYDIAKCNYWDWFFTLTFDPEKVNSHDYEACCHHMGNFCKCLRRRGVKYIFVPELHKSGAFHFHGFGQGTLDCLVPAINPYTGEEMFDSAGRQIYNCPVYTAGFSTVTAVGDSGAASNYLMKYLSKELGQAVPQSKKRYWCSRGLERPEKQYCIEAPDEFEGMYMSAVFRKDMVTDFGRFWLYEFRLES